MKQRKVPRLPHRLLDQSTAYHYRTFLLALRAALLYALLPPAFHSHLYTMAWQAFHLRAPRAARRPLSATATLPAATVAMADARGRQQGGGQKADWEGGCWRLGGFGAAPRRRRACPFRAQFSRRNLREPRVGILVCCT